MAMSVTLGLRALSGMMPMHLLLDPGGRIIATGDTLARILPGVCGYGFFDVFALRRPAGVTDLAGLLARSGARLQLQPRLLPGGAQPIGCDLRGQAVPLAGGGALVNLSFGIGVVDAVRAHGLTEADFAVTDLTVELMYLVEANASVTEALRQTNRRLHGAKAVAEAQALTDALTGLGNRRALQAALDRQVAMAMPFALIHLDLDRFKQINDSLGHAAGDQVLVAVARRLAGETRAQDTVARIGGDEFVLLLPGLAAAADLQRFAARLLARLDQPILLAGAELRVAGSLGMVISQDHALTGPDGLLHLADSALYAAKRAGRGQAVLSEPAPPPPHQGI
jgi:diguanylate cyclase (GGDEF)-like protein